MTDLLYVSFDKDEKKKETGICVGRVNKDGSYTVLKMELDNRADTLYKILTDQSVKTIPNDPNQYEKGYADAKNEYKEKLEQIRTEIDALNNIDYVEPITVVEILQIIDKYRQEG